MTILKKLKQRRKELKLTQEEVALHLGYESRNAYWAIENGVTELKAKQVRELAEFFTVPVASLLEEKF